MSTTPHAAPGTAAPPVDKAEAEASVQTTAAPVRKKVTRTPAATVAKPSVPSKSVRTSTATAVAAKVAKPVKSEKIKLVRDSFTIPKAEYAVLDALKLRGVTLGRSVKKSELLRAGIATLAALSDAAFVAVLKAVPAIKTGRPKNTP